MEHIASPDALVARSLRWRIDRCGVSQAKVAAYAGFPPRHLYDNCLSADEEARVHAVLDLIERGVIPTLPRRGYRPRRRQEEPVLA